MRSVDGLAENLHYFEIRTLVRWHTLRVRSVPAAPACLTLLALRLIACEKSETDSGETSETSPAPWFDDATLDPAYEQVNAIWFGVAMLDYDVDGWLDLYFTNGLNHADGLYRNNGDGSFTDMAAAAGVTSDAENGAVVSGDLDNDGDPDLVVSAECTTGSWNEQGGSELDGGKILYLNQGDGTFSNGPLSTDHSLDALSATCAVSLTLADWNGDGFLDLILANGADPDLAPPWIFDKHAAEAVNYILLNDGTGHFGRPIAVSGTVVTFVILAMDVNEDGRMDLVEGQGGREMEVFLQDSDGQPVYAADRSSTGRGLWMGLAAADYDADGDIDVYSTNEGLSPLIAGYDPWEGFFPGDVAIAGQPTAVDTGGDLDIDRQWISPFQGLFINDGAQWAPAADWPLASDHLQPGDVFTSLDGRYAWWQGPENLARFGWAWGAATLDANADGWPDVIFSPNNCASPMDIIYTEKRGAGAGGLLINDGGHGFVDATWDAGVADTDDIGRYLDGRGIAVGDLNNDGYADFVLANRTYNPSETAPLEQVVGIPMVKLSHPREGNWLQVKLVGTGTSNRDAIGARVRVTTDAGSWMHLYGAAGQTNSSSERLLTLGLGASTAADLEVVFPDGTIMSSANVPANQRLTIVEE